MKNKVALLGIILFTFCGMVLTGCQQQSEKQQKQEDMDSICQTDYTQITYSDGCYYYQSEADHFYLYRADEDGKTSECLAKQVPKEIYVKDEWVYFTNYSDGQTLYRIRPDGSGMEKVLDKGIERLLLMGDRFYYIPLPEDEETGNVYSWTETEGSRLLYVGGCKWIDTDGENLYLKSRKGIYGDYEGNIIVMDEKGNFAMREKEKNTGHVRI